MGSGWLRYTKLVNIFESSAREAQGSPSVDALCSCGILGNLDSGHGWWVCECVYLDPKSMQSNGPKLFKIAQKAIILRAAFGFQVLLLLCWLFRGVFLPAAALLGKFQASA